MPQPPAAQKTPLPPLALAGRALSEAELQALASFILAVTRAAALRYE